MPESPVQNPMFAPLPAARPEPEDESSATVAFLPPLVSRTLIAAWILLFSSRWLVVQGLIAAGFFGPDPSERIDRIDSALGRCYLFLLSVTLVLLVVRIVQGLKPEKDPLGSKMEFNPQAGSVSGEAEAEQAEASDRGGKQA